MTVYLGAAHRNCPAGTGLLLPRGHEHTFRVESEEARLLVVLLPAGPEDFYLELGAFGDRDSGARTPANQDMERLVTVAARYGVEITGPGPDQPGRSAPLIRDLLAVQPRWETPTERGRLGEGRRAAVEAHRAQETGVVRRMPTALPVTSHGHTAGGRAAGGQFGPVLGRSRVYAGG